MSPFYLNILTNISWHSFVLKSFYNSSTYPTPSRKVIAVYRFCLCFCNNLNISLTNSNIHQRTDLSAYSFVNVNSRLLIKVEWRQSIVTSLLSQALVAVHFMASDPHSHHSYKVTHSCLIVIL